MKKADVEKALVFAAVAIGVAALARRVAPKLQDIDWEERFERMPDTAPPKWMFTNIRAIHDNTDRILELLANNGQGAADSGDAATE